MKLATHCLLLLLLLVSVGDGAEPALPPVADRTVDFVQDIQPILRVRCLSCHDAGKQRGGLRLDLKSAAFKGGETYSQAIIPGNSAESPLVRLVAGLEEGFLMPPEGERLTDIQIGLLRAWIDQGAKWPDTASAADDVAAHWSFQPITRSLIPATHSHWTRNPIDSFVADLLLTQNPALEPSPEADRVTLIRRLNFDLLGLPPAPEDVAEFVSDPRPDAYERLADRLLASPHFGERWARHWLDVVRFAESDGFETNQPRPNAWPYRDYVIRSFNEDKPFAQFVTEQLAGDTLGADEATGFIVGGAWDRVKSPDPGLTAQQRADELHDMVSTTASAFLGLTVGCARCHNHKFDPIPQTDYYALKAVFAGVQHGDRPIKPLDFDQREQQIGQLRSELARVESALRSFEPRACTGSGRATVVTLLLDDDTPEPLSATAPGVSLLVPRKGLEPHRSGTARGQAGDPGDARRLPNLGRNYSYWNMVANKNVFSWNPHVAGAYHVWISWGCGWNTHASDARYLLDVDGDLATTNDQQEIARVDQRRFSDGAAGDQQPLWSGFYHAGIHDFSPNSRLILRGGETDAYVTADLLCLQEANSSEASAPGRSSALRGTGVPLLRAAVQRQANVERFAPITARFLRFVIEETNGGSQPCIDELEVFTTGTSPRNAALDAKPTASSTLPGYEIHQLKHINDGRYGNSASWISNEPGRGWVQLEFPQPVEIDRVLWSRDRPDNGQFSDRIATKYRIEAGLSADAMVVVATSQDRLPIERNLTVLPTRSGLSEQEQFEAGELTRRQESLRGTLRRLTEMRMAYAGRFVAPEPTHRFHRGDPLQPREPVAPAGLSSFGPPLKLPLDAPEAARRIQLAQWMTATNHPLTNRVLVNRFWHFHFGQGLVTTPSDFGRNGASPSHPQLLDWLASEVTPRLPAGVASPKRLHRLIITSATYRQSGVARPDGMRVDAGSRLLWRFPPRRLEAEPLRDAILSVCGNLDDRMGGPGFDLFEPNTNYVKVYNTRHEFGPAEWRRMVYQSKPRMQLDDTFGQFDCPDAGQITPKRTSSITALQALNLLNSHFIVQQAELFAGRLTRETGAAPQAQVRRAFSLAFLRTPTPDEQSASVQFINQHGLPAFCRALLNANEFLFVF
ncbi:MAG: PSD1 domain-containing protein [Planctomycetes bacterium]|nr:PSD1 domain-containing protein [Planctomycetota bacterium]